jgi:hypothetical protein
MLAFAMVFSVVVTRSAAGAFIGASLAWLLVSVAAWCVRRKSRGGRSRIKSAGMLFRGAAEKQNV